MFQKPKMEIVKFSDDLDIITTSAGDESEDEDDANDLDAESTSNASPASLLEPVTNDPVAEMFTSPSPSPKIG